ncbi:MAG: hypothetical protein Q8J88_00875 [Bacteroidales bacterium]|nr:hypothetical protein [Bacteroidales bacterium]
MGLTGQNFIMWKGDDRIIQVTIEDASDVSGFTAKWHMAVDVNSPKLITKTSASGTITFNGNKVLISLSSAETKDSVTAIPEGMYYHELELIDAQNKKAIAASGIIDLKKTLVGRP